MFRRKHTCYVCTDLRNRFCRCRRCIARIGRPPTEIHTCRKLACARIIQDLFHVVALFDIHRSDLSIKTHEVNKESSIGSFIYHHIHREVACVEAHGSLNFIRDDVLCDQLAAVFAFVVNADLVDVPEALIENSDQHWLLRLPAFAIFV